jgi:membrane protease YdiL (CAAX protease family)
MNKVTRGTLDVVLFLIVFIVIQIFSLYAIRFGYSLYKGIPYNEVLSIEAKGTPRVQGILIALTSILSSVVTLALFIWRRWAPVSRIWIASHPWMTIAWVVMLTLGSILPFQWAEEQLNLVLPEYYAQLFEKVMSQPIGYLAIGILGPLAEELVFRGAILRTLLRMFSKRAHWAAIIISALIFGAVHGNLPQFVNATLLGLLIGWMYYRTDSIVPGVVLHWVNNTVAYVMFNLMPQMADGKLIDLFHGDHKTMVLGIVFSLCIFLPSLFQLNLRLKKNQ